MANCHTFADPSSDWTAHKVELAVWTDVMIRQLDPSLLDSIYTESSTTDGASDKAATKKRRSESAQESDSKTKKSRPSSNGN